MTRYYTEHNFSSTNDLNKYQLLFPHFLEELDKEYSPDLDEINISETTQGQINTKLSDLEAFFHAEIVKWKSKRRSFLIESFSPTNHQEIYDNYISSQDFSHVSASIIKKAEFQVTLETSMERMFIDTVKKKHSEEYEYSMMKIKRYNMSYNINTDQNYNENSGDSYYKHERRYYDYLKDELQDELKEDSYSIEDEHISNETVSNLIDSYFLENIQNASEFENDEDELSFLPETSQCQDKIIKITQSFLDGSKDKINLPILNSLKYQFNPINLEISIGHSFELLMEYLKDINQTFIDNNHISEETNNQMSKSIFEHIVYNHYMIKASYSNKLHQTGIYKDGCSFENTHPNISDELVKVSVFYLEKSLEILDKVSNNPYVEIQNSNNLISLISLNQYYSKNINRLNLYNEKNHSLVTPELQLENSLSVKEALQKKIELEKIKEEAKNEITPVIHDKIHAELYSQFQQKTQQISKQIEIDLVNQTMEKFDKLVMEKFLKIPSVVADILPLQSKNFTTEDLVAALNGLDIPNKQKPFNFDIEYPSSNRFSNNITEKAKFLDNKLDYNDPFAFFNDMDDIQDIEQHKKKQENIRSTKEELLLTILHNSTKQSYTKENDDKIISNVRNKLKKNFKF